MAATSTCFCGAIQLAFSIDDDNLVTSVGRHLPFNCPSTSISCFSDSHFQFICHCTDDRKITSSVFATNFIIKDATLKHVRGQDKLTKFAMTETIATGNTMTSNFCSICGSLMYRVSSGFPGVTILRLGQVDDLKLFETALKPRIEQFSKDRVSWLHGVEGLEQHENQGI